MMSGSVVFFPGARKEEQAPDPPEAPFEPDAGLLTLANKLLEDVRNGVVRGIAYAGALHDGSISVGWQTTTNRHILAAAAAHLNQRINR